MKSKAITGVSLAVTLLGAAFALPASAQTPPLLKVVVGTDYVEIDSTGTAYYGGTCNSTTCPTTMVTAVAGNLNWTGTIDGFMVNALNGRTTPVLTAPQIDVGVGPIIATNAGTITIYYTATGFTVGETPGTMNIVAGAATTQVYTSYVDDSNAPFGTGITVGTTSTGGIVMGPGPASDAHGFSMTSKEVITLPAGGVFVNDYSLTVAPYPPLSLTCSAGSGVVGTAYSSLLVANGGKPSYTYSIISGSISPLQLNSSTGAITGTPTTGGTLSFTAQVTDSSGLPSAESTVTASCKIVIAAQSGGGGQGGTPTPLKVTCPGSTATVGTPYKSSVGVTGGTPPYTYKVVYGSLPAGLILNSDGSITGTPTTAGETGAFRIQVTDSSSPAQVAYTNCSGSCQNGTTVSYGGGGNPQNGWGQKSWTSTYTSNSIPLTVYGWDTHGNHANLWANNYGGQSYLGIANDQWGQNQIDSNHFVQCDLSAHINGGATGGSLTISGTGWGAAFDIYGSNTLGQLGTLLQGNVQLNTWSQGGQSVSIPQFGKYKYICVKAHQGSSGGVSICNISCNYPCSCSIDVGGGSQGGGGYGGQGGGGYGGQGGGGYGGQGGGGYGGQGGGGYGGQGGGGYGGQGSSPGQCGW